jgi:mono/diheme cytochrome c family protein
VQIRTGLTLVAILAATTMTPAFAQAGADTYKAKCQMCHGADGMGNPPMVKAMGVKPLNAPEYIKTSDADLIASTTNGKGKMPAQKGKLTDAQIKDTVAYVRTLQKK